MNINIIIIKMIYKPAAGEAMEKKI